jgi:acetyltransferase-like isoleucine patch superfamily enzyme
MSNGSGYKVKEVLADGRQSASRKYRSICYGTLSLGAVVRNELIVLLTSRVPGALGLALRGWLYPLMFGRAGRKVVFGRGITLRHPHKITIGDHVVIDDNVVLDAKGDGNRGVMIGDGVYIGRNTIVYCKNGDITIEDRVNVSSNCQLFSSNDLTVKQNTVIGAFTYLLSGGEYDYRDPTPFSRQAGTRTKGPTVVGPNNWLGARVTILDGVTTGAHCVFAAGAVATRSVPPHSLVGGIPGKVLKSIDPAAGASTSSGS